MIILKVTKTRVSPYLKKIHFSKNNITGLFFFNYKDMGQSIQEWAKQSVWTAVFKTFEEVRSVLKDQTLQVFQRLSSTKFTLFILEDCPI